MSKSTAMVEMTSSWNFERAIAADVIHSALSTAAGQVWLINAATIEMGLTYDSVEAKSTLPIPTRALKLITKSH